MVANMPVARVKNEDDPALPNTVEDAPLAELIRGQ